MDSGKMLSQESTKRIWRGFFIGSAVGTVLSLSEFGCILLSGIINPFLLVGIYMVASLPARALYSIIGEEFYPYLLSSFFAVLVTDSIILGFVGAACVYFFSVKRGNQVNRK